jgi:hypothetical protein
VPSDRALSVARGVAEGLARDGAEAVVLVGSHARGDPGPESDLDLLAVGQESYLPRLAVRKGMLVSVSVQPPALHRESFERPELACEAVPGWRDAMILHDPKRLAGLLIRQAREWTWTPIEQRCDAWVAGEITARAETVLKLVAARDKGWLATAAAKRFLIVTSLARALAVHHRILYGSENALWRLVGSAMGETWRHAQSSALGLDGEPVEETCQAALELYGLAADEVGHLLDERQERVAGHALEVIGLADR